jgi:hypothetical protein
MSSTWMWLAPLLLCAGCAAASSEGPARHVGGDGHPPHGRAHAGNGDDPSPDGEGHSPQGRGHPAHGHEHPAHGRHHPAHGHGHAPPGRAVAAHDAEAALAEVARVHGGAGPWAVAGYRMGEHALRVLAVPRGSFDLEVVHHGPKEVQYACIADGAAASTGASLGKLNLSMVEATAAATHTVYRNKATGASLALRLTPSFIARFRDLPRADLADAGRQVLGLREAEVFEKVVDGPQPSGARPAATMKP